jgi:hypothetical protein
MPISFTDQSGNRASGYARRESNVPAARASVSGNDRNAQLKDKIDRLRRQMSIITSTTSPEALSTEVINDARYTKLKNDYEDAFIGKGPQAPRASQPELEERRRRISDWLKQIYIPEQKNTFDMLAEDYEAAEKTEMDRKQKSLSAPRREPAPAGLQTR